MMKILGKKNAREEQAKKEEEEKQKLDEETKGDGATGEVQPTAPKVKKAAGEIRLRKDLQELDLPSHAAINFPD